MCPLRVWLPWVVLAWTATSAGALERPVSLAAGDVDGDGHPDIVSGFATSEGGRLAVHWHFMPHRPSLSSTISMPDPPFHLFVADLDGDGPAELLAAADRGRSIHLFRSKEGAKLEPAGVLALPGALTALAVGDLGIRDGSPEIIAAVDGPGGPRVLVLDRHGPDPADRAAGSRHRPRASANRWVDLGRAPARAP